MTTQHLTPASLADGDMAPPFMGTPRRTATGGAAEPESAWEELPAEGSVEPAFEADVSETEAALAALSQVQPEAEEEFPLDAFIIPAHTRHVPTGLEGQPKSEVPAPTPISELAEKLEKLSHRLRVEDAETVLTRLAAGDKLDTMLAGLLAGYLAGAK
ncbi:MAG TPA: hypothetical protein VF021_04530 [Longimicrobiales bacterium]